MRDLLQGSLLNIT